MNDIQLDPRNEVPIFFTLEEQLGLTIHQYVAPKYTDIAIQHIANTVHYLLKHKIKPPNRRALIFNVAMTLLGYVHGQDDYTLILSHKIMEYIKNAKQRQAPRSSITISKGTSTIRSNI